MNSKTIWMSQPFNHSLSLFFASCPPSLSIVFRLSSLSTDLLRQCSGALMCVLGSAAIQRYSAIGVRYMKSVMRLLNMIGYSAIGGPKPLEPLSQLQMCDPQRLAKCRSSLHGEDNNSCNRSGGTDMLPSL